MKRFWYIFNYKNTDCICNAGKICYKVPYEKNNACYQDYGNVSDQISNLDRQQQ